MATTAANLDDTYRHKGLRKALLDKLRGMDITISTTAASDEQGRALLAAFNFPFRS